MRLPAQHPRFMAGWNLNNLAPRNIDMISGSDVARTPIKKSMKPSSFRPLMNVGPEVIPITAMNVLSPRLLRSHADCCGMNPKVGRLDLSHPRSRPAMSAPPLVLRLIGTPPRCTVKAPMIPPMKIPNPTNIRSVFVDLRSA